MSDLEGGSAWYLTQVRPNQFHIAEHNLARQGFPVFCPTQEETRRRGGRFVSETRPLFPGYVFVSFNPASSAWRTINSTYGVSKLVTFGGRVPAPVPRNLVAGLMARCDRAGHLLPPQALKPGDKAHVLSGPFAQFVATVESLAPQQRVWVLLEILGGQKRVSLDLGQLRTA
jgi:transcriptional antiterminator RfaH